MRIVPTLLVFLLAGCLNESALPPSPPQQNGTEVGNGYSGYDDTESGDGGDAVTCRNENGELVSVEFFDLFEGRELRHRPAHWPANLSKLDILNIAFNRLEKFSPLRAAQYRKWLTEFFDQTTWVKGVELPNVDDTHFTHLSVPSGCIIEQVISNLSSSPTDKPQFVINENLWEKMDAISQAATIFQALLFAREAVERGHTNSIAARYFHSFVFSNRLSELKQEDYELLMQLVNLPLDYRGNHE